MGKKIKGTSLTRMGMSRKKMRFGKSPCLHTNSCSPECIARRSCA